MEGGENGEACCVWTYVGVVRASDRQVQDFDLEVQGVVERIQEPSESDSKEVKERQRQANGRQRQRTHDV